MQFRVCSCFSWSHSASQILTVAPQSAGRSPLDAAGNPRRIDPSRRLCIHARHPRCGDGLAPTAPCPTRVRRDSKGRCLGCFGSGPNPGARGRGCTPARRLGGRPPLVPSTPCPIRVRRGSQGRCPSWFESWPNPGAPVRGGMLRADPGRPGSPPVGRIVSLLIALAVECVGMSLPIGQPLFRPGIGDQLGGGGEP